VALEPQYAPYHVNVATAAMMAGDTTKAVTHLERAIALDRSFEQAYRQLSAIYTQEGQMTNARAAIERYLRFMPGKTYAACVNKANQPPSIGRIRRSCTHFRKHSPLGTRGKLPALSCEGHQDQRLLR
jgi:tetratricopeptide (TPR) repeat protein